MNSMECYSHGMTRKKRLTFANTALIFSLAALVFADIDAVFEPNTIDEFTGEERFDVIGVFSGIMLFVVYVERLTVNGNDIIRIISARKAEKEERECYVNGA